MSRIPKGAIIIVIILIAIFALDHYTLEPIIREKYLENDIRSFKDNSLIYKVIFVSIMVVFTFLLQIKRIKSSQISEILIFGVITWFSLFLATQRMIDHVLLYINTKTEKEQITKIYSVVNHEDKKVFWLNDGNKSIYSEKDLENINRSRI